MADTEQLQLTQEEKAQAIHHWFWEDFKLLPPEKARNTDEQFKGLKPSFWHEFVAALHQLGRLPENGSGSLHHWFWHDFALGPRHHTPHQHDCCRGSKQWCWEDCTSTSHADAHKSIDRY